MNVTAAATETRLIALAGDSAQSVLVERTSDLAGLQTLLTGVRREALSMLPAGPYPIEVMRSSWEPDLEIIGRGVAVRVLYQADATRTPEMLRYLGEFVTAGAHVRVTRRITHRIMIMDRRLVVVAVHADTLRRPYLIVREPALVQNFCEQFAAIWRDAHSVGVGPEDSLDEGVVREILEMLTTGVTDDVAARHLHVSARTIRRRVAAVMDLLGASSRFEAGVKAAQAGWV